MANFKFELKSKKISKSIFTNYLRFHSSVYSRVLLIILSMSVILLLSYGIIFRSVNHHYLETIIRQNGSNIGSIVEGALYQSMMRNDKTELYNTLDIINTLSGIDEVNLYDNYDSLVYSSYAVDANHFNDPNCLLCHSNLGSLFPGADTTYRIIDVESACSMYQMENQNRYLLIRKPIMNDRSCYTSSCHAHSPDDKQLGSLIIKLPLKSLDQAINQSSVKYFLFALIATVLLSSFLVIFTNRNIKRPLHLLVDASIAVTNGNRDARIIIKPNLLDDMRLVSLAFNEMLDNLEVATSELENWSKQLEYKVQKKSEELSIVQNELIQIERIASLGKLSASVAHELNNPLSGILIYTKLVYKQLNNPDLDQTRKDSMLKHLKLIEGETKRCGDIVKGLLDFSKRDQSDHELAHLNDIAAHSYELMKHTLKIANISFLNNLKAKNDTVSCSPNQIKQACVALLVNASEAIPTNTFGEIIIQTSNPDDELVLLEIIDNGKGIDESNISHIFEPFFSTKHDTNGIGLGLAIVHGIIQSHNGTISVISKPNLGTTMAISLPLIKNPKHDKA